MKTFTPCHWNQSPRRAGRSVPRLSTLVFVMWLALPLDAEVIDDFSQGQRFTVNSAAADTVCEIIQPETDGQLKITRPRDNAATGCFYLRTYALPEGRPVEFRVDMVSANAGNLDGFLGVEFKDPALFKAMGYAVYRRHGQVDLLKYWDLENGCIFWRSGTPSVTEPVTLSLTLTRLGDQLKLGVQVIRRDSGAQVFAHESIDGPGVDGSVLGTDNGAPFSGPVGLVGVGCWADQGDAGRAELVLDNLACSDERAPLALGIEPVDATGATLSWQGANMPFRANSILGPWIPCLEGILAHQGGVSTAIALEGPTQFYRLVPGFQHAESFDGAVTGWRAGCTEAGKYWSPGFARVAPGYGRLRGTGVNNHDFVLRRGGIDGVWYRDCAASVDIVDWDETMADASIGIVLRAKPNRDLWFHTTEGLPNDRYAGLLTFKQASRPSESALSITGPGGEVLNTQPVLPAVDPARQYRLQFRAVGDRLTLELFALNGLERPELIGAIEANDGRIPEGMDALYGTKSAGDTYHVTIDRFVLTGATR